MVYQNRQVVLSNSCRFWAAWQKSRQGRGPRRQVQIFATALKPEPGAAHCHLGAVRKRRWLLSSSSRLFWRAIRHCGGSRRGNRLQRAASRAPMGISPVSARRHSAITSLRMSATIRTFFMRPLAPPRRALKPLRKRALGLMPQPAPGQLAQHSADSRGAVLADPLLGLRTAAVVGRACQSDEGAQRPPVLEGPLEHLVDEHCRRLHADPDDTRQRLDHALQAIRFGDIHDPLSGLLDLLELRRQQARPALLRCERPRPFPGAQSDGPGDRTSAPGASAGSASSTPSYADRRDRA